MGGTGGRGESKYEKGEESEETARDSLSLLRIHGIAGEGSSSI